MIDTLPGEGSIDETASYEPELLDWIIPSKLGERSLCFFESEDFPRPKRSFSESLEGLMLTNENPPRRLFRGCGGPGYGAWDIQFAYRDYRFLIESNSHAALGYFWVNDPSCPKSILLEVLEHFLGPPQEETPAAPLPPRGWLDELKDIGCAILLVAFVIGVCFLLVAFLRWQ